jgi:hypothetical protein
MTTNTIVRAVVVLLAIAAPSPDNTVAAAGQSQLRISVYPSYTLAPANVRVQAVIEPARENRALEFVVESPQYYRSSTIELDGEQSARVHVVQFRALSGGTYEVRVMLVGGDGGARAVLYHRVMVVE